MQVISGKYKNLRLESPNDSRTHPMGSREKLALFNMLQPYLEGARVLDAFAGTGALGIEALSRGAGEAVFVEKSAKVAKTIKNNLAKIAEPTEIFIGDAEKYTATEPFDVIIADPPYDHFEPAQIQALISLLKADGILVLSHPNDAPELNGLKLVKTRSYAAANISIYQHA